MDKDPIKTRSYTEIRPTLQVLGKSSRDAEGRIEPSRTPKKIWLGFVVIALFGIGVIGLVLNSKRTNTVQLPSPEQEHIKDLAGQLSSLTQTDLIVFPDGRVWYVRSVHGKIWRSSDGLAITRDLKISTRLFLKRVISPLFVTTNRRGRLKGIGSSPNSYSVRPVCQVRIWKPEKGEGWSF